MKVVCTKCMGERTFLKPILVGEMKILCPACVSIAHIGPLCIFCDKLIYGINSCKCTFVSQDEFKQELYRQRQEKEMENSSNELQKRPKTVAEIQHDIATNRYNLFVAGLVKPGQAILDSLTPGKCDLWHMASCIPGEGAELFDAVKKHVIYDKGAVDRENIIEELGDLEFYMQGIRNFLEITREETLIHNVNKLYKRYAGARYSDQQALERNDKKEPQNTTPVNLEKEANPHFHNCKKCGMLIGKQYEYCERYECQNPSQDNVRN